MPDPEALRKVEHSDDAVMDFIDSWAHDYANDAWRALSANGQMQAARAMMDVVVRALLAESQETER